MSNPTDQEIIDVVELNQVVLEAYFIEHNYIDNLTEDFNDWIGDKSHSEILDILDEINKK